MCSHLYGSGGSLSELNALFSTAHYSWKILPCLAFSLLQEENLELNSQDSHSRIASPAKSNLYKYVVMYVYVHLYYKAVILSNMPILIPTTITPHTITVLCFYTWGTEEKERFSVPCPKKLHCILSPLSNILVAICMLVTSTHVCSLFLSPLYKGLENVSFRISICCSEKFYMMFIFM